jgi:Mn-containing catalase
MEKELEENKQLNQQLSKEKSQEVKKAEPEGIAQWSDYVKTKEQ